MVSAIARCYTSVPEAYLALFFPWQAPCPFCMQTQDELAFLAVTARAARYTSTAHRRRIPDSANATALAV